MTTVTITKMRAASVAHGRGSDSYRTPAKYDVLVDGVLRGKLFGRPQRFRDLPKWEVYTVNPDNTGIRWVRLFGKKAAAVEWINAEFPALVEKAERAARGTF
jgi:hypothetical protein